MFLWPIAMPVAVGWFAGRTWKNNSKWDSKQLNYYGHNDVCIVERTKCAVGTQMWCEYTSSLTLHCHTMYSICNHRFSKYTTANSNPWTVKLRSLTWDFLTAGFACPGSQLWHSKWWRTFGNSPSCQNMKSIFCSFPRSSCEFHDNFPSPSLRKFCAKCPNSHNPLLGHSIL